MLEVNDFDAIRISLASPEQVRSWSYGEVVKPETINYRTLKPEKDGLFCEKIFGPQKDFECMCGKYKRVRYKGIICDKCGVEVTRSKVRRERMGHIGLAAPASHIWFVKGTPSRMALLLDISPRALERVIYFSQFILTSVNAEQKAKAIEHLKLDVEDAAEAAEKEIQETLKQLTQARDARIKAINEALQAGKKANKAATKERLADLKATAKQFEAALQESDGRKARRNFNLDGEMIVERGGDVHATRMLKKLQTALSKRTAAVEKAAAAAEAKIVAQAETDEQQTRDDVFAQEESLKERLAGVRERAQAELEERVAELESLRDPVETMDFNSAVLTEQRAAELQERYPGVLRMGMGAEAVLPLLDRIDLDQLSRTLREEVASTSGQRRKKAMKRLRVVEALRKSGNRPAWMVFRSLPVLPPDLRPMVQLDGGRFATSDLNDLYRRVINRNNRLKRLLELGAPEIIIRNEKRMLQEAVDSLIDNGRRGRAVTGSGNHKLKSLSDMLKGKQGRFRQNLLGKRVDYAGRSVIVVGPELKLHQCGLPKRMALELFKPFIMHELVKRELAHNIKSAKRVVERAHPEVWDVLEDVVKQRPVLLNRAPTLHRLGIQAFEPVLVDGSAIQIHPLVCSAFNADFDGDQMAVHIPLSREAVAEARQIMLSTKNLLLPSSGEPVIAPTLDMVMGCYYLTLERPGATGEYREGLPPRGVYGSFQEARLAHDLEQLSLHARIRVRDGRTNGEFITTTVGRIIFDDVVPDALPYQNQLMDKKTLKDLVSVCYKQIDGAATTEMADRIKDIGFRFGTRSGVTIAVDELRVPEEKYAILDKAEKAVEEIRDQFQMGLMTDTERYNQTVKVWTDATDQVSDAISDHMSEY
ncbi:MAG: DNA-directed RNA polymerase subunit beta', partial [Dehalococcoidia bacterium]